MASTEFADGITRIVASWLNDVDNATYNTVNVKQGSYGAKGDWDGSTGTDDTAAIQAAIDTISSAGGGVVYMPPGSYAHTGLTLADGTVLRGEGSLQVKLYNTSSTNDSITVPYNNDSNFYEYLNISGVSLYLVTAENPSQAGLRLKTCRYNNFHDINIFDHYYGIREQSSWSNDLSNINIQDCVQAWWVESGASTGGTPNYRSNINVDACTKGLLIENNGNGSTLWAGGSIEGCDEEALKIIGNTNRAITFQSINFEGNNAVSGNYQIILGDDADSDSASSNTVFKGCQYTNNESARDYVFDLNRGTGFEIDGGNFIGYTNVADISANFGTLAWRQLTNITNFAPSTHANTTLLADGTGSGTLQSLNHINADGVATVYQSASTNNILESRRHTESYNRFDVDAEGKFGWHPFDTATADTFLYRAAAGVVAVDADMVFRSGSGITGSRPGASTVGVGSMWFDTTLGKPIWSDGTNWVDATGTTV